MTPINAPIHPPDHHADVLATLDLNMLTYETTVDLRQPTGVGVSTTGDPCLSC